MDVVSLSPLGALGFVWQLQDGRFVQTVVVKATYTLAPGQVTLASEQDAPSQNDEHWNDDPTRSIISPSDKVPYKPRADVLLVGHAYAPNKQPVRSLMVRLIVGDLDKSAEVFCDRGFRLHDGQILEGQRFVKSRLSWERAAGGPDTNNPIGMRFDAPPDAYGMVPVPNLQPPGLFVSKRSESFAPIGFGPVAPSWPGRNQRLGRLAGTFAPSGWWERPLPEGFDFGYFQAAPPDQQVAEIRRNERIVLENLHPDHPRLVTSLSYLRPRAIAERATGEREDINIAVDTLLIDTDRGVCVVVWRGRVGLRHAQEQGRISVTLEEEPDKRRKTLFEESSESDEQSTTGLIATHEVATRTLTKTVIPGMTNAPNLAGRVMPFVAAEQNASRQSNPPPPPRPSTAALPFLRPEQPPQAPATGETPPSGGAPSWFKDRVSPVPPPPTPAAPPPGSPWAKPPAVPPPGPTPGIPSASGSIPPPPPIAPPPVIPAPRASTPDAVNSPWVSGGAAPNAVGLGTAAAVGLAAGAVALSASTPSAPAARSGSVQAISDAAADLQVRPTTPSSPAPKSIAPAPAPAKQQHRLPTNDVLDLLWYEESFVPRIRSYWEELVTDLDFEPADPRRDLSAEDPEKARVRHNVFGILTDGEVVEPPQISRVINEAVNQKGRFTPPLALTAGELRFPFDEVETLKAMIVAMTPFLGSDKKLKEMVDGMTELLKTPYLQGSTGIVDKLAKDLRAQFRDSNRSLPPTYLDGHVERLLLEQRRYAIRKVFGGEFIRALLTVYTNDSGSKGSDASIPVYLPKHLDQTLPMLVVMRVRLIVECHLQQDPYDASPYALRTVALGRAYQLDALRSGGKGG